MHQTRHFSNLAVFTSPLFASQIETAAESVKEWAQPVKQQV
ncbi:hypothetical protein [Neisseria sp. Dent CA1/247]|nr:hypothetical protein [Neisseria sp. Dent CA1/247]